MEVLELSSESSATPYLDILVGPVISTLELSVEATAALLHRPSIIGEVSAAFSVVITLLDLAEPRKIILEFPFAKAHLPFEN